MQRTSCCIAPNSPCVVNGKEDEVMNKATEQTGTAAPEDALLRQAMREALRREAAGADDDGARQLALQQRVLAQWQLRQQSADASSVQHAGSGSLGLGRRGHESRRRRQGLWLLAGVIVVAVALLGWRQARINEAALNELLQPDLLSQMALGEL
jgi:hypothetical protein